MLGSALYRIDHAWSNAERRFHDPSCAVPLAHGLRETQRFRTASVRGTLDDSWRLILERRGLLSWKYPWSWGSANVLDWTLHLSDQIPIELEIETATGRSALELGSLRITDLKIRANTSEMQISLPDREGNPTVHIDAKTAYLTIRVPPDVTAYIHGHRDPVADEIDPPRFPILKGAAAYRSEDYETASKRVDIRIDGTMASVKIL